MQYIVSQIALQARGALLASLAVTIRLLSSQYQIKCCLLINRKHKMWSLGKFKFTHFIEQMHYAVILVAGILYKRGCLADDSSK
mmetsp:Transcript_4925/g.8073  ORF Transcript_4925/g.8073 Transcript_4925/m.8073 type:complete len:84 (+) Transcript_4925:65-316(+)